MGPVSDSLLDLEKERVTFFSLSLSLRCLHQEGPLCGTAIITTRLLLGLLPISHSAARVFILTWK